jgi:hypothetical protein
MMLLGTTAGRRGVGFLRAGARIANNAFSK